MKKHLRTVSSSSIHWVGNGFPVRSVFDYDGHGRELSPFLLLDYASPHEFPAGNGRRGVGAHPHKGFETVTVVYRGELEHRDSSGGGGVIGPGDVQWMTAGRGIVHEEFHSEEFTRTGGTLEMVQLWVNLRSSDKQAEPGYQTLSKESIPTVTLDRGAGSVRVIAGSFGSSAGPAKTFSPMNLLDVSLAAGGRVELSLAEGHTAAVLVLSGEISTDAGKVVGAGGLGIFSHNGADLALAAGAAARVLVMSGEPIDEPIVGRGPFVMNSIQEIESAYREYQEGTMGQLA